MFFKNNKKSNGVTKKSGMALAEIVIGAAIMSVAILSVISMYTTYVKYALSNSKNISASYILEEGLEVMTFFRDTSWVNISGLSTETAYYLTFNGTSWATTTSPQYVDDQFLRIITVENVYRDANDDIDVSGNLDSNIRKITTTVSYWQGHATTTRSVSTYLTNI